MEWRFRIFDTGICHLIKSDEKDYEVKSKNNKAYESFKSFIMNLEDYEDLVADTITEIEQTIPKMLKISNYFDECIICYDETNNGMSIVEFLKSDKSEYIYEVRYKSDSNYTNEDMHEVTVEDWFEYFNPIYVWAPDHYCSLDPYIGLQKIIRNFSDGQYALDPLKECKRHTGKVVFGGDVKWMPPSLPKNLLIHSFENILFEMAANGNESPFAIWLDKCKI